MNLIDSSAWLEYFAGGPAAQQFDATIGMFDADFKGLLGVKYFSKSK